jgi:AcrR family transcriptional regulator
MSRSRPYHHGDLKRAIIDAAARLVESEGQESLTFRRLAEELGVSHAAPLAHYPDRAALDDAVAARACRQLGEQLAEAGAGSNPIRHLRDPAAAQIRAMVAQPFYERLAPVPPDRKLFTRRLLTLARAWIQFAAERPGLFRMLRETPAAPEGELAAEKARISALVEELVVLAQRAGEFRKGIPPARLARLITATIDGLAQQLPDKEEAEQTLELLLRGIAS